MDRPPLDPDDWTEEQWLAYLHDEGDAVDPSAEEGAPGHRRVRSSATGTVLGAAMMGLEQALYGERPSEEIVAEAHDDDPDRDLSRFDPDDPTSATLHLAVDPDVGREPGSA